MARTNTVRIEYARVSGRSQDHQLQLHALDAADCREVIVETASTHGGRPKLFKTLKVLKPGDTLVIYKPDRIARSMPVTRVRATSPKKLGPACPPTWVVTAERTADWSIPDEVKGQRYGLGLGPND